MPRDEEGDLQNLLSLSLNDHVAGGSVGRLDSEMVWENIGSVQNKEQKFNQHAANLPIIRAG
jgi:hypothetical protein